jgi:hypothetical protein
MCPVCILTMAVNGLMAIAGSLGLIKLVSYIKKSYYLLAGKK